MEKWKLQTVDGGKLAELIADGEDWLTQQVLAYAKKRAYGKYTSTLEEAWRLSIAGLSQALLQALQNNPWPYEIGPDDNLAEDPSTAFGILEAQRHRSRGITISMFLGLLKYYRQSYLDLVVEANLAYSEQDYAQRYINRFFDRVEIAFVGEWAGAQRYQIASELQTTNRHLSNEKNKYLTIFESMPNPALLINSEHRVDNLNHLAAELFCGLGKPGAAYYDEIKLDMELPWLTNELALFANSKEAEWCFEKALAGHQFEVRFKRMLDLSDKYRGTVVILNDVTERNRVKEELQVAKEVAEAANQAKSDFLATVGHEIRTPMNEIVGLTQLTLGTDLNANQREYLEELDQAADTLSRLLTDILDYSSAEAGRVNLDFVSFGLRDTVDQALRSLADKAHSNELELLCDVAADVPDALLGDPGRLSQVIVNLVDNAIKFTDSGEVVLRARVEWVGEHDLSLRFAIKDTGKGISARQRGMIFDAFATGERAKNRKQTGNGLGLAISARLAELMGGRIWVESEENVGSTFYFTARFGLIRTPDLNASNGDLDCLEGREVLVVDDNATNRKILSEFLSQRGIRATTANGAAAGLQALLRAQGNGERFDLVLIDAKMPDEDGFSLLTQIRAQRSFSRLPVIMMTTSKWPGEESRAKALAISACLAKPIPHTMLWNAIRQAVVPNAKGSAMSGSAEHSVQSKWSVRALIVDHSIVNQKRMAASLEEAGHTYSIVSSGSQALEVLSREEFDLLLIGLDSPECDELAVAEAVRKAEMQTGKHILMVAVTSQAVKEERNRCLAAGFDDYLTKPIRPEDLRTLIERMPEHNRIKRSADRANTSISRKGRRVVDLTKALEALNGDRVLLGEVVNLFLRTSQTTQNELSTAIEKANGSDVAQHAHQLKRSLANLGAREAASIAAQLEVTAQQEDFTAARQCLTVLAEKMARVRVALSREICI